MPGASTPSTSGRDRSTRGRPRSSIPWPTPTAATPLDCTPCRGPAWHDVGRGMEPVHLTTLWLPVVAARVAAEVARFAELVRTLRQRCPWDREQTHESLTRHLLEETYEVLEAIESLPEGIHHLE